MIGYKDWTKSEWTKKNWKLLLNTTLRMQKSGTLEAKYKEIRNGSILLHSTVDVSEKKPLADGQE